MIVLGLDPSLTHFGWTVFDEAAGNGPRRFIAAGAIASAPLEDETKTAGYARRCVETFARLREILQSFPAVRLIALESVALPRGRTSLQTVSALGRVRGLVDALAVLERARVAEYQPAHLKRIVGEDLLIDEEKIEKEHVAEAMLEAHPELRAIVAKLAKKEREHALDAASAVHAAVFIEHR